jgi:hypothetical protein
MRIRKIRRGIRPYGETAAYPTASDGRGTDSPPYEQGLAPLRCPTRTLRLWLRVRTLGGEVYVVWLGDADAGLWRGWPAVGTCRGVGTTWPGPAKAVGNPARAKRVPGNACRARTATRARGQRSQRLRHPDSCGIEAPGRAVAPPAPDRRSARWHHLSLPTAPRSPAADSAYLSRGRA